MKKAKLLGFGALALGLTLAIAGCGNGNDKTTDSTGKAGATGKTDAAHSAVIVTDVGGVDDRSFNQSAWEGLKAWGKENNIAEGAGGYMYIQSNNATEYTTNVDSAVSQGFKTIYGVGYLLKDSIKTAAEKNKDSQFVIVDDVIEGLDNVVSATFKDNEAAYLAGYGAAYTTKTNKIGFIGGEESVVIDRFHGGFQQGIEDAAKELGKTITLDARYAASFGDPAKGKALASSIYQGGADIIYHASGGTGAGLFQEAKALNEQGKGDKVWAIGVDRDQNDEGKYKAKDGKEENFTLTSTLKGVGSAVQDISNRALKDEFPGGENLVYGLKDGGVDITEGNLSKEALEAIKQAKQNVVDGKVTVQEKPSK